ncbi:MAG: hypothetical protein AB7E09_07505 [Candidatus Izemoplasmatales bacterium]
MIEDKYNIKYINNFRCYKVNLAERKFFLEYSSPRYMQIDDYEIYENNWAGLLEKLFNYLFIKHSMQIDDLLLFSVDWSKKHIFSLEKMSNFDYGPLNNGLFYNVNQSATHLQWIIQDFLIYLDEDLRSIDLYIKIPTYKEKSEVIDYYLDLKMKDLKLFLRKHLLYDQNNTKLIVSHLLKIDKVFHQHFKHQVSLLLLDNKHYYAMYKSKFLSIIKKTDRLSELYDKIKNILDDLTLYYAHIEGN